MTKQDVISIIGISRSKYYQWGKRVGIPNAHNGKIPKSHWLLVSEQESIICYCKDKLLLGYRRLTYMMIDENVVFVSPATVYRILNMNGLLNKWDTKKSSSKGNGFIQPLKPHEHWHTDISYVNLLGTFYFLITVLDGYSRMILHHELRANMEEYDVEIVLQRTIEKYPESKARLISDNGSQFISKDFKEFVRTSGLTHVKTSVGYPQSNGKLERYHKTIKTEKIKRSSFLSEEDARAQIAKYVDFYNNERLHSAIYYLTPREVFDGNMKKRLAERQNKLDNARINRLEKRAFLK